jgi:hypothetical protein
MSWSKAPIWGLRTDLYYLCDSYGLVLVGRPLWREDGSVFCICCWPSPAQSFLGPSPLGLVAIFYCLRFEASLFVASYDSQGHGGGIRSRLHTGITGNVLTCPPFINSEEPNRDHHLEQLVVILSGVRCHGNLLTELLPSKWNSASRRCSSGFQTVFTELLLNNGLFQLVVTETCVSGSLASNGLFRLSGVISQYFSTVAVIGRRVNYSELVGIWKWRGYEFLVIQWYIFIFRYYRVLNETWRKL